MNKQVLHPLPLDSQRSESGDYEESYTPEDEWLDQLSALPTTEQLEKLLGLMRTAELKEYAKGLTAETVAACKAGDLLEVARVLNGWVATAEEIVTHRRNLRYIRAARSQE